MKAVLLSFALGCVALGAAPDAVRVTRDQRPHHLLKMEVTVPASLDAVWEAFTTREGLKTWLSPDARVDLRNGGEWTAIFPGNTTGGGTITDIVPKSELVMRAMAPEWFPSVRAERTTATFRFTPLGPDSTLVQLEQTGWHRTDEWDKAYDYLASGNAVLLDTLRRRFVSGPIDWSKAGSATSTKDKP
jgi:uncharacterized protein YndB with AHSA1/START domain